MNKKTKRNIKHKQKENGQIIVFFVLSLITLSLVWMILVDIAILIKDRIMLQNAVDCAAQSAACIRARGINKLGALNAELGAIVQARSIFFLPGFSWIPYKSALETYKEAKTNSELQEGIIKTYGGGLAYLAAERVAKAGGADGIIAKPGTFSLGVRQDMNTINFYDTIITPDGKPVPNLAKPFTRHLKTWSYFKSPKGPDKNIITAYKKSKLKFFGGGFFGIKKFPEIMTIAAGRPYNKHGSMLPAVDNPFEGFIVIAIYAQAADGYNAQLVPVGTPFMH